MSPEITLSLCCESFIIARFPALHGTMALRQARADYDAPSPNRIAASHGIDQSGCEQGQCRMGVAGRGAGAETVAGAVTSVSRSRVTPGQVLQLAANTTSASPN